MKLADCNNMTASATRRRGLLAALLLVFNFVPTQDALADTTISAANAASYLYVEMSNDLLTLRARNAPLGHVLDEIARRVDLLVVSDDPPDGVINLEIERVPLAEALRRIMRGQSYLLYQVQPATGTGLTYRERQSTLWIFADESADELYRNQAAGDSKSNTKSTIELLQSQLMSDDIRTRREAIKGLRRLEGNEVIAPLSYALLDEDKKIRVKAVYALAAIGGDNAIAALASASGDENAWVRAETAYALGMLGGDTAIRILEHALHDADDAVRESAIEAFTEIGGAQSAAALAVALQDPDTPLRVEAADALAEIGGDTAAHLLAQALQDHDNAVREAAKTGLAQLHSQEPYTQDHARSTSSAEWWAPGESNPEPAD